MHIYIINICKQNKKEKKYCNPYLIFCLFTKQNQNFFIYKIKQHEDLGESYNASYISGYFLFSYRPNNVPFLTALAASDSPGKC